MARMHSRKKGVSGSTKPPKEKKPTWVRYEPSEVEQLVLKLAKGGESESRIGIVLRDKYGIPDVRRILSKRLHAILKEHNVTHEIPEDLMNLIKKETLLIKHLEQNKKDESAKRGLLLTESKIKRLSKYYRKSGVLPKDWTYSREQAKLITS